MEGSCILATLRPQPPESNEIVIPDELNETTTYPTTVVKVSPNIE